MSSPIAVEIEIHGAQVSCVTADLAPVFGCLEGRKGITCAGIDVQSPSARPGGEYLGVLVDFDDDVTAAREFFHALGGLSEPALIAGREQVGVDEKA